MPDFSIRSSEPEILDNLELEGNDLTQNLRELQKVNQRLGGYDIVFEGIKRLTERKGLNKKIRIVDVGCGGGDTLLAVAGWAQRNNLHFELLGIDANSAAVKYASIQTKAYPEISVKQMNIFDPEFQDLEADILMFNLVLHHFSDEQIIKVLKTARPKAAAILINDLQRTPLAYHLFRLASRAMRFSYISRHDGKLSIRKSSVKRSGINC